MFETINLWIQDHQQLVYSLIFTYCVSKASILPVFVGVFVVSESLLLGPSMIAMISGSVAGDLLRFWLGRKYGDAIVRKMPDALSKWMGKTLRLFEHYGVAYILLCRYPNTIRSISVFPVGMSSMSFMRFLPLSIASILIWIGIYFALGYVLGEGMSELLERNLTLLSPVLLVVFLGLGWFGLKRIDKLEQQAEKAIK
ncbi:DedA family protein [Thalassospira povalilytica]|uniref:DedA family protein n=1 Tax=Thalassospira povalilytica TaxID=732237 RepID=UPI001D182708|nr:DedA family protein [Thalassospira povalilytica]MCC4238658.1 DedA family protein [Thalassospira povalilytica]